MVFFVFCHQTYQFSRHFEAYIGCKAAYMGTEERLYWYDGVKVYSTTPDLGIGITYRQSKHLSKHCLAH
jgi:hypothetical protein